MSVLTVGDPLRKYYLWCLVATPGAVVHRNINATGRVPSKAACGYRPRAGWAYAEFMGAAIGTCCRRCAQAVGETP